MVLKLLLLQNVRFLDLFPFLMTPVEILFLEMEIKGGKKTKTGTYSTDSGILEELSLQGYEIAKLVLKWREVSKLRSTYTDAL